MDHTAEVTIPDDDIIAYIKKKYSPEDVFDVSDLEDWAKDNGFIEEEP